MPGLVGRALAALNRVPVGERAIRVGPDRLYVASLDRVVAALGWKLGWLEAAERRLLARVTRPGMIAVDVGANVGVHTLLLARRVGPGGRVHALEPAPENFRLLARAVREAGLAQVRLHAAAAGARAGAGTLVLSAVNRGDHRLVVAAPGRETVAVRVVALDEVLADEPRVDVVKMDVQGAEAEALAGLERTLARSPGIGILCELCPALLRAAGTPPEALVARLAARGLAPHRVRRDGMADPVTPEAAVAAAETAGFVNLWFHAP